MDKKIAKDVRAAYRWILGRDADPGGLADVVAGLSSGEVTPDDVRRQMIGSAEFARTSGAFVQPDRSAVTAVVVEQTGGYVRTGPFAGMRLATGSMRGDGDVAPKLLGTYEAELHPALARCATQRYDAIVDVGCAEGYYSVGLARLFPGVTVHAFDTDAGALAILAETAADNGCADRIVAGGFCDPAALGALVRDRPRSLIFLDCEGYERTLLTDPAVPAAIATCDVIVECHDLYSDGLTQAITTALGPTHDIETVRAGGRDPNVFDFLAPLSDLDRWLAVWERRQSQMHWLVCRPKRG